MIWNFSDGTSYQSLFIVSGMPTDDVDYMVRKIREDFPAVQTLPLEPVQELLDQYQRAEYFSDLSREVIIHSAQRRGQQIGPGLLLQYEENDFNLRLLVTRSWISIVRKTSSQETQEMESIAYRIAEIVQ